MIASLAGLFRCRQPFLTLISENGPYKLIMRSDKPEAREFQDWMTRVVLPAIRKEAAYVRREEQSQMLRALSLPPRRFGRFPRLQYPRCPSRITLDAIDRLPR
ncbi:BRO-N domain-containing protein [Afifella marina]|uniref:BRO-N domain-containing protein n=1 Tax=Afifella marina TaxID=1080 RepID=UPI000B8620E4|nr:BRO family protein [Afifella marina]MBK1622918.1 hypothetical protein [Afifella marina DSM 2698]MBK1625913.1 hypothetical protein [Afifella marina]MBK5917737.1 hypothetical protein [Afifella marina]RAI23745.1 hypothetical protein CH311_01905 [Afifella marina DSM 2698]